jgi:hypothetical protein
MRLVGIFSLFSGSRLFTYELPGFVEPRWDQRKEARHPLENPKGLNC